MACSRQEYCRPHYDRLLIDSSRSVLSFGFSFPCASTKSGKLRRAPQTPIRERSHICGSHLIRNCSGSILRSFPPSGKLMIYWFLFAFCREEESNSKSRETERETERERGEERQHEVITRQSRSDRKEGRMERQKAHSRGDSKWNNF